MIRAQGFWPGGHRLMSSRKLHVRSRTGLTRVLLTGDTGLRPA